MAQSTEIVDTNVSTTDIYQIASVVESIKNKYIEVPEDTLVMGVYGYLNEIFTNTIENATRLAAEYANEAVPTRAKFEKNVIAHALSLGINSIQATPAYMECMICIPESNLVANMKNDIFIFDREFKIQLDDASTGKYYEYHVDYDIIIHRNMLPKGKYVYTAMYDMDNNVPNKASNVINPYLPAMTAINITGEKLIAFTTKIRQVQHNQEYKKILVSNPLESKTITFTFEDQLVYFDVIVQENGKTHYLQTVYDGLSDDKGREFCNYMYLDNNTIRIKFNRDSYQPRYNSEVTINIWTTKGSDANFSYNDDKIQTLTSDTYAYNNMWMMLRPITNSKDGMDRTDVEYLRKAIPKQMLMRGSITTVTDLNNYFNFMSNADRRLYFLEKIHNQLTRLFYSYMLLKMNNNIVPTNTLNIQLERELFDNVNNINYVIEPGKLLYLNTKTGICSMLNSKKVSQSDIDKMDSEEFLYLNPFLILLNKNPFFAQYYLNILDYNKTLDFEYINQDSECQFIATRCNVKRQYFTDRDTYKITITMEQNVNNDFGLIETDTVGNITKCKIYVYGVVYKDDKPYRYLPGILKMFDDKNYKYSFEMDFKSNDVIDRNSNITITSGMHNIKSGEELTSYVAGNIDFKFFVLADLDKDYGRNYGDVENLFPKINGYSLCNVYGIATGLDVYYDYSDLVSSYTTISENPDKSFTFYIKKMPLVRYTWFNTEERVKAFLDTIEDNRIYIEDALVLLSDSFGIDFKFFNTYGPSLLYSIDNNGDLNRVNMNLTFEVKFVMDSDKYIVDDITADIKGYLEDINEINDLHMPNLITFITNKYRNRLVYFKFLDLNGYGPVEQSIYREDIDEFVEATTVPEFLNVDTKTDNEPNIKYIIKS